MLTQKTREQLVLLIDSGRCRHRWHCQRSCGSSRIIDSDIAVNIRLNAVSNIKAIMYFALWHSIQSSIFLKSMRLLLGNLFDQHTVWFNLNDHRITVAVEMPCQIVHNSHSRPKSF